MGVGVGVGQALCDLSVKDKATVSQTHITTAPCESHQAFHQEEIEIEVEEPEIHADEDEVDEKGQEDKEREVWDLVREERYEIVEQLPLTIHRQLSLMRQLDEQSQSYVSSLLPMLNEYIELRRSLASGSTSGISPAAEAPKEAPTDNIEEAPQTPGKGSTAGGPSKNTPIPTMILPERTNSSAPMPIPIERTRQPKTSREYLSHIAWLSEEVLRASQEKVNLAQATYDVAERHIRLLDLAIKEQEASLNSTEGSIQLPDLTVPKSARNINTPPSNDIDSYNAITIAPQDDDTGDTDDNGTDSGDHEGADGEDGSGASPLEKALMKTIAEKLMINPTRVNEKSEELYCYCNRVSFGDMIACDNPSCTLEWFHLGCAGYIEPPEGEWYCENCTKFDA
ncbi:hypothetical protein FA13DRAFT_1727613 [Coprinellus micaceus]|uniref:Chromatin modification-related protein n=1 Tax=Coprinellus micaceus TaxID=71717 RepID=A0A4Y7TPH1_COPMI|nr:hypothetical protein FA13DRAFT_1727613 [Coprinellus micaceus]